MALFRVTILEEDRGKACPNFLFQIVWAHAQVIDLVEQLGHLYQRLFVEEEVKFGRRYSSGLERLR